MQSIVLLVHSSPGSMLAEAVPEAAVAEVTPVAEEFAAMGPVEAEPFHWIMSMRDGKVHRHFETPGGSYRMCVIWKKLEPPFLSGTTRETAAATGKEMCRKGSCCWT